MDIITKTLCNNYTNLTLLGFTNVEVNGSTITFTFQDGSTATVTLPTPADGKSITNVNIDSDGSLICTLSDGTTINAGTVPTVKGEKGDDGFSPVVTVEEIEGGHKVSIEDETGIKEFEVLDSVNDTEIIHTDLIGFDGVTTVLDLINALLEEYRTERKNVRFECGSLNNTILTDLPQAYGYLTIKVGGTNIVEVTFAYSNLGFKTMYCGYLNRQATETLYSELNWEEIPTNSIPVIEDGNTVIQHKITKNKDITDLPISTDRSGNKICPVDDLYLTYEFEEFLAAIEQWFTDKGITPERGMTYDDIEQIEFYVPSGGGYFYANSYFKFDNTAYLVYCLKYQDVEYQMFQMSYDHTNKKFYRNVRYGLNVINFGVLIPALAGSSVKTDILEVFHNWFKVYKPIGFDNSQGVPLSPNYDKKNATLSQNELVNVTYGQSTGTYDLGNGVSFMTSPLQRLLFTVNKEATELRAYANSEGKATYPLSAGFFDSNLLQPKNTFQVLEDMSSLPVPTIGTFGVYTVTPNATGQPEALTKGGTLITAHITANLYSQSVNYIGTRIAIFFTEGAMYYTLGTGGKYYPTSAWTSPVKWNKITTTLV